MSEVDPLQAAAESQLDRHDEVEADRAVPAPAADGQVAVDEEFGLHIDDPEADLMDEDLDVGLRDDAEADALDTIAELFNARDLDALLEVVAPDGEAPGLLGYDRDNLPAAVEDLWTRRPTCCLTRGRADVEYVGVLWEHDGEAWWRVAVVHVDDVRDGNVGVLEFSDDPDLLEQVECDGPDDDLDEGATWVEWEEGSDGAGAAR